MGKDIRDIFLLIKNKVTGGKVHHKMDTSKECSLEVSKSQGLISQRRGISSQF